MNNYHKPTKEETDKVRLRTDEIQDIVGIVPKWFVRYGISVIFAFLCIIIIGCWFFKYPDIVSANVSITANNLPTTIVARSDGRLVKIFIKDNQLVKENEVLAVIENSANYTEVFRMKEVIDSLGNILKADVNLNLEFSGEYSRLGDIQPYYSSFIKQLKDFKNFVSLDYHSKKIASLNAEIVQQKDYLKKLNSRMLYSGEQLNIAKKQYVRDSALFKNQVIALADFEKSQNSYLQAKSSYELSRTEIISIELQITKLNQSILDLSSERLEKNSQTHTSVKESFDVLVSHIADWEKAYVLKSSTGGTITFTRIWSDNQNIKAGETVFTVIPSGSLSYIAKIQIPVQSSGKVKAGQRVIIKLADYPYMEYGLLYGNIKKISLVPEDNFYFAEVELPSILITSYGTDISQKNEYKGSGEIITRNQRLILKFINPLRSLWEKNKIQ
jgi:multidrug resistance efflux pump